MSTHPYVKRELLVAVRDVQPMILVLSNNSGLIVPLKTIQHKINGIQMCKSRLGWEVFGSINDYTESVNCSLDISIEEEADHNLDELIR